MSRNRWIKHRPLFVSPVSAKDCKPKTKWRILPILWEALKRTCMVLGALMLFSSAVSVYMLASVSQKMGPAALPDEIVLFLKFQGRFNEVPPDVSLSEPFAPPSLTVHDYVEAIDRAAGDPRVKGIFARMYDGSFSLAHLYEIRGALERFKSSGKFAHIYSSSYGGGGAGGLGRYYLASAFDEIWMQPMGIISIGGLRAEVPFARDVLDKIGINPQFYQRKEYKTAYESLTNKEMSPQNREVLEQVIEAVRNEVFKGIVPARGMNIAEFGALIDKGLFTAREAEKVGLITHADYVDVLAAKIREEVTGDPDYEEPLFVDVRSYLSDIDLNSDDGPRVALIYAVGAIMDSKVGVHASSGLVGMQKVAAADEIAPAIIDALKDDTIEAIVLRVDSPGGSPVASESILRALERAQDKGKKVIVSMGPMAASGGYWISSYADQIFVLPTTLTGSIGVVGGKFSIGELWKKIGINWDGVQWGQNSGMWSLNTPFSDSEEIRINAMLDEVYRIFLMRVSKGRGMSVKEVDRIARGHVWTGRKAVELGLADQIGGLHEALSYTATLLGETNRGALDVVLMPRAKTPFEQILEMLGENGAVFEGLKLQQAMLSLLRPVLEPLVTVNSSGPVAVYEPLSAIE